jgi:hypothetical protein
MTPLLAAAALAASLTLSADPAVVRPDRGGRSRLVVEVREVEPAAPVESPRLSASVGAIRNLRADGPLRFVADYVPPEEAIPQVALISATLAGETRFLALPLYGLGDAEVHTRKRGLITVRIGEERFGPVQADARGVAQVPVVVPPGVRHAFRGSEPIDLHVPATRTLHLALASTFAPADRDADVAVRVFVVDATGAPKQGAALQLRPTAGTVDPPADLGQGLYGTTWRLPPGPAGEASISASLDEAPAFAAKASLLRAPGPAASLVLEADRERLVAGQNGEGELRFVLRATLRDAAGNPADDALLVSPSLGTAEVTASGLGVSQAAISVPAAFAGARQVTVAARCARGPAAAALSLPLLPAPPAQARIELAAPSARADGETGLRLRVVLSDRFGNPVPEASLEARAEGGILSAAAAQGDGSYLATFTPALLRQPGTGLVRVRSGAAEGSVRIPLSPARQLLTVTPKLGALSNFARISSPLAALEGGLRFEAWGQPLAVLFEAGWFFSSHNDVPTGAPPVSSRDHFVLLSAGLQIRPEIAARTRAFFSLSPSLALLHTRQQFAGQPSLSQSAAIPGLILGAGLERNFDRFTPLLEARFSFTADPGLSNLREPVRGFALLLGTRFEVL